MKSREDNEKENKKEQEKFNRSFLPSCGIEGMLDKISFNERGLVPAVLQDVSSGRVLMLAYMNREALRRTIAEGKACFYSRSRQQLWLKGETSGNYQLIEEIRYDCDKDALLLMVEPSGPACHTGEDSCFYRSLVSRKKIDENTEEADYNFNDSSGRYSFLDRLIALIESRERERPEGSYTAQLFNKGTEEQAKKIGEEGVEMALASLQKDRGRVKAEAADLIYHLLVMLVDQDISFSEVVGELSRRFSE